MGTEKLYLMHYPSRFGMGSNTGIFLVTEESLRRIIEREVKKYRREKQDGRSGEQKYDLPHSYDEWYTGTINGEVFCDSEDINEVIEDVKKKRMSSVTTYSKCNDLIMIPEDYPVIMKKEVFNDTVFQVFYRKDIIAGEAEFTRYFLDFRNYDGDHFDGKLGVKGGFWHEFTSFKMKRVLEHDILAGDLDLEMKLEEKKIQRIKNRQKGIRSGGTYIDDLLDLSNKEREEFYIKELAESEAVIRKLEEYLKAPASVDDYNDHIYDGHCGEGSAGYISAHDEKDKEADHVKGWCFQRPHMFMGSFCIRTDGKYALGDRLMTYGELFSSGDDFESLAAFSGGTAKSIEDLKYMNAECILQDEFGDA